MRKALVETTSGLVVNVIVADDYWEPPEGFHVVPADGKHIAPGDSWDGENFIRAIPTPDVMAQAREKAIANLREVARGSQSPINKMAQAVLTLLEPG